MPQWQSCMGSQSKKLHTYMYQRANTWALHLYMYTEAFEFIHKALQANYIIQKPS